jgi:hypothetical protein
MIRLHLHRTKAENKETENLRKLVADVKKNGNSLHFPPMFVKHTDLYKVKQTVHCEAVRITNE